MSYFFSTQLYSKTPIETLEPRLSRYLVWWLCINLQFSIEGFYIQVQLSDCDVWLTVCIQSLNGNISLEISTFRVNVPTFTQHSPSEGRWSSVGKPATNQRLESQSRRIMKHTENSIHLFVDEEGGCLQARLTPQLHLLARWLSQ